MKKILMFLTIILTFVFTGCSALTTSNKLEYGKTYSLVAPFEDSKITITVEKDRVFGHSGVNRYNAGYTLNGSEIKLGPAASTRMAGEPLAMEREDKFLSILNDVTNIQSKGATLTLRTKDNRELVFKQN